MAISPKTPNTTPRASARALSRAGSCELEDKIARAEVIDVSKLSGTVVKFGATVTLADEETDEEQTYQIVGEDEADISNGRLSVTSPLARALIGKGNGDSVEVIDAARRQILRGRHRRFRLKGTRRGAQHDKAADRRQH